MAKRNINYIKPDDPPFLKVLKKQAGYDDKNHKFDELQNDDEDFVNDNDSEQPQVVVLNKGDLTAEEAEIEKKKLENEELQTKADLTQKIIFNNKKAIAKTEIKKRKGDSKSSIEKKKTKPILSFDNDEDD